MTDEQHLFLAVDSGDPRSQVNAFLALAHSMEEAAGIDPVRAALNMAMTAAYIVRHMAWTDEDLAKQIWEDMTTKAFIGAGIIANEDHNGETLQ